MNGAHSCRRLFNRTPDVEKAFRLSTRSIVCVDEGIIGGIHLAGSGVLLPIEELRSELQAARAEELTTHDNCGAFAIRFPDEPDPNRSAAQWGKRTAAALGLPHRHIAASTMDRPAHTHNAEAIYYDGTGVFNRVAGLPTGFVVSRAHFRSAPGDLSLCLRIAFGPHGLRDRFSSANPLLLIPLAHPSDPSLSLEVLEREAHEAAREFGSKVKIDGVKTSWLMRSASV
jgi:hypothetical protein